MPHHKRSPLTCLQRLCHSFSTWLVARNAWLFGEAGTKDTTKSVSNSPGRNFDKERPGLEILASPVRWHCSQTLSRRRGSSLAGLMMDFLLPLTAAHLIHVVFPGPMTPFTADTILQKRSTSVLILSASNPLELAGMTVQAIRLDRPG